MRTSVVLALVVVNGTFVTHGEMIPSDTQTPLFQIYELHPLSDTGPDPHSHKANLGKLLLSVSTLAHLQVRSDNAVTVILNPRDARKFSKITHTHQYVACLTGDEKAGVTMHFSGPIDDGVIPFTAANYGSDVARYLRRRFPTSPNQALQSTAGRSDAPHQVMKTLPLQSTPALASGA